MKKMIVLFIMLCFSVNLFALEDTLFKKDISNEIKLDLEKDFMIIMFNDNDGLPILNLVCASSELNCKNDIIYQDNYILKPYFEKNLNFMNKQFIKITKEKINDIEYTFLYPHSYILKNYTKQEMYSILKNVEFSFIKKAIKDFKKQKKEKIELEKVKQDTWVN